MIVVIKMDKIVVSFPHMGNYYVPIQYFLSHALSVEFMIPPKITSKTIELGSKYSPDFVCTPFKYTLGTMIEALDNGANILIQMGGGCRYGYYSEVQEKILKDLGYQFRLFNLITNGKTDVKRIYKMMKKIDPKFSIIKALYYFWMTSKMIKYMDKIEDYIRQNVGFEEKENSFENLEKEMFERFTKMKNPISLWIQYLQYKRKFKQISINKPTDCLKVGIIGELYTVMEPFSNYYLEKTLAKFHIQVKRFTNVHYLLFTKGRDTRKAMRKAHQYMKYQMAADASNNVYWMKYLCENGYDGIIHIKSSFCTPEIGIIPILQKISNQYDIPITFFSFDANTSEVGIQTRLEAFYDMIEMRKKK